MLFSISSFFQDDLIYSYGFRYLSDASFPFYKKALHFKFQEMAQTWQVIYINSLII